MTSSECRKEDAQLAGMSGISRNAGSGYPSSTTYASLSRFGKC